MMRVVEKGWGFVVSPDGQNLYFYESGMMGEKGKYYRYDLAQVSEVTESEYFEVKYGAGYRKIMETFKDSISESFRYSDGSVLALYFGDSILHKFDSRGELLWKEPLVGEFDLVYGIAVQGDSIWCAYPVGNTVKQFSFSPQVQEIFSLGERCDESILSYPESVAIFEDTLYICEMGNNRISCLDLKTYKHYVYQAFDECAWEYAQVQGREIVRLQSGIYLLDERPLQ